MKKDTKKLLGWAALGIGAWYLFGRSAKPAAAQTDAATFARPARPFGDPSDPNSVAYACNVAWRLNALGHPREAAYWAPKCTAGGGTVPADAAHEYT